MLRWLLLVSYQKAVHYLEQQMYKTMHHIFSCGQVNTKQSVFGVEHRVCGKARQYSGDDEN